jgi:hypothetical protein
MSINLLQEEARKFTAAELGRAVYSDVRQALSTGQQRRSDIVATLTEFYLWLGSQGCEDDQDASADVLDAVEGFSSPTAAL